MNGTEVDAKVDAIVDYFERFDLETGHVTAAELPDAFLVLTDGDACLGAVGIKELHDYLFDALRDASLADLTEDVRQRPIVEGFLARLDQNVYSLTGERRLPLVCVSQLLESRAWRRGAGSLHAGVQRLSTFESAPATWTRYRKIAEASVETTVYGQTDWEPEDWGAVTAYGDESGSLVGEYWFVIYSGPEKYDDGALLAHETETNRYTGFWTFDSATVDALVETLVDDYQPELTCLRT
ncbi:hypothetical protein ATH50_0011 [Haloplanus aerogenes]|uniref:Histidine kinase n=1 Tax=Haloplanus aerogenes TaxID=660522 RepID=A0A3M0DS99_9EURY|nr:hypothetical protein ATH50_0011 [Haloplanus aerogenes]